MMGEWAAPARTEVVTSLKHPLTSLPQLSPRFFVYGVIVPQQNMSTVPSLPLPPGGGHICGMQYRLRSASSTCRTAGCHASPPAAVPLPLVGCCCC